MSESDLRKMIDFASKFCDTKFRMTGEVSAQYHAVTARGENILHMPIGDKDTAVAMVRALFELRDVVRYVFFSEAWTVEKPISKTELEWIMRHGGVRSHPRRIEIIMLQGEDREAGLISASRNIVRPAGKRAHLGPLEWHDKSDAREGRMVGLLPIRGMKQ